MRRPPQGCAVALHCVMVLVLKEGAIPLVLELLHCRAQLGAAGTGANQCTGMRPHAQASHYLRPACSLQCLVPCMLSHNEPGIKWCSWVLQGSHGVTV